LPRRFTACQTGSNDFYFRGHFLLPSPGLGADQD
jgi:hypothetical protein